MHITFIPHRLHLWPSYTASPNIDKATVLLNPLCQDLLDLLDANPFNSPFLSHGDIDLLHCQIEGTQKLEKWHFIFCVGSL